MARELRDVLHYFLDDDEGADAVAPSPDGAGAAGAEPEGRPGPEDGQRPAARARAAPRPCAPTAAVPILACPLHSRDALRLALAWNLAAELEQLGRPPHWVAARPPVEAGSELDGCGSFSMTWIETSRGDVSALRRAALEPSRAGARGAKAMGAPPTFVLMPLPTDLSWSDDDAPLLGRCWLAAGPSDRERSSFLSLCERILSIRPDAELGLTVVGVADLRGARRTFASLAEIYACRFDRRLRSQGLVLDERELYRTLTARRPLSRLLPDSRAARTLRDAAELIRDDLEPPGDGACAGPAATRPASWE